MQQQWRIRVRGQQRKQIDVDLLVQAVIAVGRQLWDESKSTATGTTSSSDETTEQESEAS
jgi:hypothetical protein